MKKKFILLFMVFSISIETTNCQINNYSNDYYLFKEIDNVQNEMNLKIYRNSVIPDSNFIGGGNYNIFFSSPFVIHIYNNDTSEIDIDIYGSKRRYIANIYNDSLLIPGIYKLNFNFFKSRKKIFKPGAYLCTVEIRNKSDVNSLNVFRGEVFIIIVKEFTEW